MNSRPLMVENLPQFLPKFMSQLKNLSYTSELPQKFLHFDISRRIGSIAVMSSVLLGGEAICGKLIANGFGFDVVVPGPTVKEAESSIRGHAQDLLQLRELIESESWEDAQKMLRKSSALLKRDIYTVIQGKPGSERPQLRKLYSVLFNNVTKLDYAARDNDAAQVQQYYKNIVVALDDILSRI